MKLIQTQYPLADLSSNGTGKGVMIAFILLIAVATYGIYLNDKRSLHKQMSAVNQM